MKNSLGWKNFPSEFSEVHACHCVGPQNGDPLCPCMMRAESQKKQAWLEELKEKYPEIKDIVK